MMDKKRREVLNSMAGLEYWIKQGLDEIAQTGSISDASFYSVWFFLADLKDLLLRGDERYEE